MAQFDFAVGCTGGTMNAAGHLFKGSTTPASLTLSSAGSFLQVQGQLNIS